MENINAYFASKITFIRYLLVILISSISIGVLAEAQNPKSIDGSWVNSGGRDHESAQNLRFTFAVTKAGEFDLRLESATPTPCIDTVLFLLDTNGTEKYRNDDWENSPESPHSNCSRNSRIIATNLSAGTYTLVAGTYFNGESGDFAISARGSSGSFNLEKSDPEENKSISSTCSGQWKSSGGKNYKSNQNPNFDLIVTAKEKVTINLTSSVDTFLYLLNKDSLRVIEENDDIRRGNYNSRILEELTPGSYKLVAATYGNKQTGTFDLTVTSTDGKSELKCSSGGEGGNSPQQPLSLGEDVTVAWSVEPSNRFYRRVVNGGSINLAYTSSKPIDFPVGLRSGEVRYTNSGSAIITASHIVNDIEQTAQYRLTVEKADQQPLESRERITQTFAPDLEFIPDVSGGSTNNQVTFEKTAGPNNIVSLENDATKLEIEGIGTVVIRAKKAGNENYNDVFSYFWLTVNKAQPWIEIGKLNEGKVITNLSDGALNIDKVFDIEVKVEQGEGETTIEVNENDFAFAYANNTQDFLSSVEIKDSKIVAKKIGRASIKVSVPESDNYFAAEKEFVLEVRPQNVEFNQQNLSSNNITKQCGQDVDVDLMIDNKPLAETLQNTGSSDDILVFASSDTSVAQVNSQTGEVDLVGTGKTTISATFFGDSELADRYNLTVNEVVQPIEFQEKDILKIHGDEISNNSIKNPIKGAQPDGSITYSIKQQDGTLFSINSSTGEVILNPGSELPVTYSATIVANKAGNSCYQAATASYTINLYNAVVKFPKPGETADKEYNIQFSSSGSTSSNNIKLYYTNTPAGKFDDNSIVKPIRSPEYDNKIDISQGSYRWDTSGLPEGNYYIIAGTAAGIDTENVDDCDLEGTKGCFIAKNPLIIEHDHGLAMDCSAMFNYPGGHLKAPYQCNAETLALRGPSGRVSFIGKHNNLKPEHYEENVFRVYPSMFNLLVMKNDTNYKFYPNHEYVGKKRETKNFFNKNMTIFSKENKFIGMDKENNIALNYPATYEEYFAKWEYDFEQYKALGSYADSEKEDLINNGSIANLVYQLPLESGEDAYQISESNFVDGDVFTSVVTNTRAKAALTKEGRIKIWGHQELGGVIFSGKNKSEDFDYDGGAPDLNQTDFVEIYPHFMGFSAMKEDNSVIYWGMGKPVKPEDRKPSHLEKYADFEEMDSLDWPKHVTSKVGDDFSKVYVNYSLFFGIQNGSVKVWHSNWLYGEQFTLAVREEMQEVANISNIHIAGRAVTLENKYGDLYWILTSVNYENPKLQKIEHPGFTKIYSNEKAFAGITVEGRIQSWGNEGCGGTNAPVDSGYIAIYSTYCSFVAVKADGTYRTWGEMGVKTGALSPKTIMVTGTQKDIDNNLVEVSLKYDVSDGTSNIKDLALYLFFDSNKLEFMGIKDEGVLGLVNSSNQSPNINIVDPSTGFLKSWSSKYGEFQDLASWPDDDLSFTDGYLDSDQLVYLRWRHNPDYRYRTFEDQANAKGFIGDGILPVNLLKSYILNASRVLAVDRLLLI
jgi:hypothetical protein